MSAKHSNGMARPTTTDATSSSSQRQFLQRWSRACELWASLLSVYRRQCRRGRRRQRRIKHGVTRQRVGLGASLYDVLTEGKKGLKNATNLRTNSIGIADKEGEGDKKINKILRTSYMEAPWRGGGNEK